MKKAALLAAALAMVLSLAACGPATPNPPDPTPNASGDESGAETGGTASPEEEEEAPPPEKPFGRASFAFRIL